MPIHKHGPRFRDMPEVGGVLLAPSSMGLVAGGASSQVPVGCRSILAARCWLQHAGMGPAIAWRDAGGAELPNITTLRCTHLSFPRSSAGRGWGATPSRASHTSSPPGGDLALPLCPPMSPSLQFPPLLPPVCCSCTCPVSFLLSPMPVPWRRTLGLTAQTGTARFGLNFFRFSI